jgi:hypothetical protein
MFLRLRQILQSPEAKEIMHHGLIAGVVAMILVAVEILQRGPLREWSDHHPLKFFVAALVLAYLGAFFVLALFESLLRLRQTQYLPDVKDTVDGVWAYKTMDVGGNKWNRGSVTDIKSSHLGFKIEGHSYNLADLQAPPDLPTKKTSGDFHGEGSLWGGDKFNFRYHGRERVAQGHRDDFGVGYYQFYRDDEDQLCIRGSFTGLLGTEHQRITRTLEGIRIDRNRSDCARKAAKNAVLKLLTEVSAPHPFAGSWIDVIYEKTPIGPRRSRSSLEAHSGLQDRD